MTQFQTRPFSSILYSHGSIRKFFVLCVTRTFVEVSDLKVGFRHEFVGVVWVVIVHSDADWVVNRTVALHKEYLDPIGIQVVFESDKFQQQTRTNGSRVGE